MSWSTFCSRMMPSLSSFASSAISVKSFFPILLIFSTYCHGKQSTKPFGHTIPPSRLVASLFAWDFLIAMYILWWKLYHLSLTCNPGSQKRKPLTSNSWETLKRNAHNYETVLQNLDRLKSKETPEPERWRSRCYLGSSNSQTQSNLKLVPSWCSSSMDPEAWAPHTAPNRCCTHRRQS